MDLLKPLQDKQTGKWGCCNNDDDIIIPCIYDRQFVFDEKTNFAIVKKNGKKGIINTHGL